MRSIGVREIAAAANVSIGTVDRALNGRKEINEKTRLKVLRIARKLGYEPNPAARALSIGRAALRIGVSGGDWEQDQQIALAALEAIGASWRIDAK